MATDQLLQPCANLEASGFDAKRVAEEVWETLLSAGAFIEAPDDDPFIFASGLPSTLKVNAEVLDKKPRQRAVILGHVASYPCMQNADVLLSPPEGMRNFTTILGHEMGVLVANMRRIPNMGRYDFEFIDESDKELALGASNPRIAEDVVTTLGSVAGVVKHLNPKVQDIHSVGFLLRGEVNPVYQIGVTDHYLLERRIPTDKREFDAQLSPRELALKRTA